ncbi:MAG TPA: hypothetical protein ENI31_01245 [Candidatus Omnitrophica bacterium]|nr:hypothetical protein [Candidatus Omnitrophota bacterium]
MKVYCNGKFVDKGTVEEILEPGFLFGWGVFETIRAYNKRIAFLNMHIERLKRDVSFLGLSLSFIDFKQVIEQLLEKNGLNDAYIRITVYKKRESTGIVIYVSEFTYYGEESYERGAEVVFSPYRRLSSDPFLRIKSISYIKSRLSWLYAQIHQKDEAIFLNENDVVQEGSRSNIFFVKKKEVFTPSVKCGILKGITRDVVIDLCRKKKIRINEGEFSVQDLMEADEIFLTSSLMEIMPVSQIADKDFNMRRCVITGMLRQEYKKIIA